MRYLDPKADLTFKRVFGEHKDLVISLLNALLPLNDDELIETVEYLPSELVPENPLRKYSIVDVRCRDNKGRQFIVEMQMVWSQEFMQRVMFNAAKAYVRQGGKAIKYKYLEPVYSLNLVNDIFEPDLKEYYHYYRMVHELHSDKVIEGLHLVFVELPKFTPHTYTEKKMQALWLRYLTEISETTREVPAELMNVPEISKAVSVLEESAYTEAQLLGYDKFWDMISVERALVDSGFDKGHKAGLEAGLKEGIETGRKEGLEAGRKEGIEAGRKEGIEAGRKEGIEAGREEGRRAERIEMARNLRKLNVPVDTIVAATGLSLAEIESL